ncbi:hypothetical protein JYK00_05835 [Thermosipho ferrireducens]|uniref:Uncharacterized protein n=1 Tax=Thermosipho ferrireducens TaxID=2571116 RepID=A0ABX7S4A9_9BACT|nr:hypothetical protein [Thermosipho ferrireducens]QTA37264.1 hypothetical protein JYK00_05835 [Thermosipho ferrireducens]
MKEKLIVLVLGLILIGTSVFGLLTEEQSRKFLSEAINLWKERQYESADKKMLDALTGSINAVEIPWYWYFQSKLDVYVGQVDKAIENLKTILTITNSKEISELLKKIKKFRIPENSISKNFKIKFIDSFSGVVNGKEYFYSITSIAIFGDKIYLTDYENKRIIILKDRVLWKIIKTNYKPKYITIDSYGRVYVLSDNSLFNLNTDKPILENLASPIIAGVDRADRIVMVDMNGIIIYDHGKLIRKELKQPFIPLDADINYKNLYILDGFNNRIVLFDIYTLDYVKEIPLNKNVWSFEVSPDGEIIYLEGNTLIAGNTKFSLKSSPMFIEYFYPHLFVIDWKADKITWYLLKDEKPIFINIDNFKTTESTLTAQIRIEDYYGDSIHLAKDFITTFEQDVREFASVTYETLDASIVNLKKDSGIEVITERFLGRIVNGNTKLWIYTGGSPLFTKKKGKLVWKITYEYARPTLFPLMRFTVQVNIVDEIYSDTIIFTEGEINGS